MAEIVRFPYRTVLLQVAAVSVVTCLAAAMAARMQFESPANLLWAVLLPMVIAMAFNRTWSSKVAMAALLIFVSLALTGLVSAILTI